jgi:hypothetical protein
MAVRTPFARVGLRKKHAGGKKYFFYYVWHAVGQVTETGPDFIGMLVLGVINASIVKDAMRAEWEWQSEQREWRSNRHRKHVIRVGSHVRFAVGRWVGKLLYRVIASRLRGWALHAGLDDWQGTRQRSLWLELLKQALAAIPNCSIQRSGHFFGVTGEMKSVGTGAVDYLLRKQQRDGTEKSTALAAATASTPQVPAAGNLDTRDTGPLNGLAGAAEASSGKVKRKKKRDKAKEGGGAGGTAQPATKDCTEVDAKVDDDAKKRCRADEKEGERAKKAKLLVAARPQHHGEGRIEASDANGLQQHTFAEPMASSRQLVSSPVPQAASAASKGSSAPAERTKKKNKLKQAVGQAAA